MKNPLVISLILPLAHLHGAGLPETIDFNEHVQPILSENCYHCHGPDSSTRAPKSEPLRLDREEFAFLEREDGPPPIIKGDPEGSELIKRIISTDPDLVMPTPDSHKKPLKAQEIALLKKWIEQGAVYAEHWSFIPPTRPEIPAQNWGENPVDAFIARKHQELGLNPNKPEDSARLLRRLTFDITGLPPTPAEVAAFRESAAQDLPTAVKMAVNRLLATDAYAEHFGRHWLDAARYADTHGIHIDNYRSIWPYRDWVIEAFRKNMPFDQFTIEQIAGDLLPKATLEQKIATGFNRCLPTTGEGGAIAKEYEMIYAMDRVATTSAVWLGLTTACAACHDHKFDPISQKDFYAMSAFFRNSTMAAMDRNSADHPPNIFAPRLSERPRWHKLQQDLVKIDESIAQRRQDAQSDFQTWLAAQEENPTVKKGLTPDTSLPFIVNAGKVSGLVEGTSQSWDFKGKTVDAPGFGKAVNLPDVNLDLGTVGVFDARDQVSFGGYLYVDKNANGPVISRMDVGSNYRGWDLWLENGRLGSHLIDQWPGKAIKAVTTSALPSKKWIHVMVTYDGNAEPGKSLTVYVDGKTMPISYSHTGKIESLLTKVPTRLGARHPNSRVSGTAHFHGFQLYRRLLTAAEVEQSATNTTIDQLLEIPANKRNKGQNEAIFDHYIHQADGPTRDLLAKKKSFNDELGRLREKGSITLIMEEKEGAPFAHILERGEYSLERDKVFAAIPELFAKNPGEAQLSRKDLAEWLVSDKNPLTARVTVNRLWYYFFGRGLVETTEDFGIMGGRPTHPQLLDFLAVEFMENNWDIQHIVKLITHSATYQQASKVTSANREKDPTNLFLWRSPRHRLEAEQIRDLALSASGLLSHKIGGPSVKPYQPEGIWEAVAMKESNTRFYKQGEGDDLYRRSLYTFWKRTAAPPTMEILNAPTREVFCVRRDMTNTPLQAFVTMNDPQFIETSRELAARAMKASNSFSQRLDIITKALMSRTFENDEQALVKKALDHHLGRYTESPDLAEKLITIGDSKPDPALAKSELAAWTLIASQIFNLDETLTK
ncbi:DUF1553 domain-containing protein [Verrucomicrobiaceae bacterium 227]